MTEEQIRRKAPLLMPYQWEPFNGDQFICKKFLELKEKFKVTTVIETGTCLGSSALWMAENFNHVVTFESASKYYNIAINRFMVSGVKNISCHFIDSVMGLKNELPALRKESLLYFLDAHWEKSCPLLEELKVIADNRIKPVIVIHDFLVPNRPDLGFDSYNGQDFTFEWISESLDRIYGADGYAYEYNSEAKGAKRGVIYIHPK